MPKKSPVCHITDLDEAKSALRAELDALKAELPQCEDRLLAELKDFQASMEIRVATNEEATISVAEESKAFAKRCNAELNDQLTPALLALGAKVGDTRKEFKQRIAAVDADVRQTFARALADKIGAACERLDVKIDAAQSQLQAQIEKNAKEAVARLLEEDQSLRAIIEEQRDMAISRELAMRDSFQTEFRRTAQAQEATDAGQNQQIRWTQLELQTQIKQVHERMTQLFADASSNISEASVQAATELDKLQVESDQRISHLEQELPRVVVAMRVLETLPTQHVEWRIACARQQLDAVQCAEDAQHVSWFSPKFEAIGAHGFQLELRMYPIPPEGEDSQDGDCAVFLWACKGWKLIYRLYVGGKSEVLERFFDGCEPHGTSRLCCYRDQVTRMDGSLRIGVELLEASRMDEHIVVAEDLSHDLEGRSANGTICEDVLSGVLPLNGVVVKHQHINHRVLEQVDAQVQLMKSRLVRRVEWRVEQASKLRENVPHGQAVCSQIFDSAAVEGLQLFFYPCGYSGAAQSCCSLFLFAPAGTALRSHLQIGKERREFNHIFEEAGCFGRVNFCHFEACVDKESDSLLIAIDIEDAHQNLTVSGKPSSSPVPQNPHLSRLQVKSSTLAQAHGGSIVKLQLGSGRPPQCLEEIKVLPSFLAGKNMHAAAAKAIRCSSRLGRRSLRSERSRATSSETVLSPCVQHKTRKIQQDQFVDGVNPSDKTNEARLLQRPASAVLLKQIGKNLAESGTH